MAKTINIGTEINLQDLLQSRMLIQANSGGGKSVLARVIIEETFGIVPFIVLDIEGEYYTLKEKFGDVLIIGGQHADIPISMQSVKLLPKEIISNRLSVVIDVSDLQMSDRILYSKYFLETMMDLPKQYWINYFIFIEEAHKLCGEQDKQASATAVKDLMSRGRKRGYCGILLTQRISKLHKDAAAECNNKFIGRTFLDIDLDRAGKELGLTSQADKTDIRTLEPGNFYAFGTSIKPHEVHVVKIKLPKTKIPKAGVNLDIKPQKPTEKIKAALVKLNDLPKEAEKEAKTIQQLQAEIKQFKKAANQKGKDATPEEVRSLNEALLLKNNIVKELNISIQQLIKEQNSIRKILGTTELKFPELPKSIVASPDVQPISKKFVDHNRSFTSDVYNKVAKNITTNDGKLGKCAFAILQFLASFPERSFSKPQVGIATSYSPGSGGFNNALSELNSKGLIYKNGGKLQISDVDLSEFLGNDFVPQEYSIHTFKDKLGKCEREIYQVLLDNPRASFAKSELADATESKYSHSSGGFNNALSTLNTLELIKRNSGIIQLNPELLELM